nr:phosphoinositide 3-phosphatase [Quercus suber]
MMAFHFHPSTSGQSPDEDARKIFFELRSRCCVKSTEALLAYQFQPPQEETESSVPAYDARREYARMGIGGKQAVGPGLAWRLSDINSEYSFSETYPSVLCVPRTVSDNMLKYGAVFRSRQRIPCLSYLHYNGGSITRSSQPKVGPFGKRNPQDEKLVTAIMSSHTRAANSLQTSPSQTPSLSSTSTATLVSEISDGTSMHPSAPDCGVDGNGKSPHEPDVENVVPSSTQRVYGSTRRNFIMDARPKTNATVNKAGGGGFEDISNYSTNDTPIEQIFLNIGNIHVMRSALQQIIDSFAHSDYLALPPGQEALRKSAWLSKHIFGILEGANKVARAVGLTGSHTLVHCSDGWDRTAQVSALAQIMLDPYYRTFGGFRVLVQKEFLSFGHKFRDRTGILGSETWFEIENERILPTRNDDETDGNGINNFGQKAISSTKSWIDKTRGNLFSKREASRESLADTMAPSPNPVLHSPVNANSKDEKKEKTKIDEISPVFHQFLDAVWQLQRQHSSAFEFNERFLSRLLYQLYAGQYGEFLFNNERERVQGAAKLPSVWAYFAARKPEFTNPGYTVNPGDALLLPKWTEPDKQVDVRELRWWAGLFRREDSEMNTMQNLLSTVDPASSQDGEVAAQSLRTNPTVESGESSAVALGQNIQNVMAPGVPTLVTPDLASGDGTAEEPEEQSVRPSHQRRDTSFVVLPVNDREPTSINGSNEFDGKAITMQLDGEDGGDPLGVSSNVPMRAGGGGLDFASFAQGAAYRER